jgi:hypothetical protein
MTVMEIPAEARAAVRARLRKEIDDLDYRRSLRILGERGYTQVRIAAWLGIAQPSVTSALKTATKTALPREGFSGASPYEICQRYAAGFLEREQLIDELARWPYAPRGRTNPELELEDLIVHPEGSWAEVQQASYAGLIDDEIYEEVFERRHPRAAAE